MDGLILRPIQENRLGSRSPDMTPRNYCPLHYCCRYFSGSLLIIISDCLRLNERRKKNSSARFAAILLKGIENKASTIERVESHVTNSRRSIRYGEFVVF